MAGHNKWSKIKHRKEVVDGKKSKLFSMYGKALSVAAKEARGDQNHPTLRTAIEKARSVNMPNANIDRAIERGMGIGGPAPERVLYEAYGPGGVALLVEGITDNKNRTSAEIRHLLSKHEGRLALPGSVTWAFEKNEDGWMAKSKIPLSQDDKNKLDPLFSELDSHDDVENIYANADLA
jgi:YebC/PmpR family DNA-binding regulatory protein